MRVRGEPVGDPDGVLGEAPETEFAFLLVPMATYEIAMQAARKENISVADVFQKALLGYLRNVFEVDNDAEEEHRGPNRPEPAIVLRKRRP